MKETPNGKDQNGTIENVRLSVGAHEQRVDGGVGKASPCVQREAREGSGIPVHHPRRDDQYPQRDQDRAAFSAAATFSLLSSR
jgi:hypothetical protein